MVGKNLIRQVQSIAKAGSARLKGDVTLSAGTNVTLTQSGNDISIASTGGASGGTVDTVVAGNNIDVDATDPANPVVAVETLTLADVSDVTASATEVNYTDGVTSAIQTQLDGKSGTAHTHLLAAGATDVTATSTELNYVDGVTSAIQTQIDGKQPLDSDLTTIAGLTATTDNFMVATASAWASRTPSQARTQLGLGTLATQSGTFSGTSSGTNTGDQTITLTGDVTGTGTGSFATTIGAAKVTEAMQVLADNTTNNASTSAHGYLKKLDNSASHFMDGQGNWSTPAGAGDALKADPLSQFAATTSLQLKGVMSDETGSGALVFADSPTLVTPALGTPASGVMTNVTGTASGLTAGTVTTNANLTGDVTSSGNATTIAKTVNPYCFRAYDSGGTTLTDGSEVPINLATEVYDYNSNFASSAYTAPYDGVYHFDGAVQITGAISTAVFMQARIYVGATRKIDGARFINTANNSASVVTGDILLAAGDVVTLKAAQDSAGNEATDTNAYGTFLSGHLVHRTA